MHMKEKLLTNMILRRLVNSEDLFTFREECTLCNQIINRPTGQESRVQLKEWLRPQGTIVKCPINLGLYSGVLNP